MDTLVATQHPLPWDGGAKKAMMASVADCAAECVIIDRPTYVTKPDGSLLVAYLTEAFDPDPYPAVFRRLHPQDAANGALTVSTRTTARGNGLPTATGRLSGIQAPSRTFGSVQAAPGRRRYHAGYCASNFEEPRAWSYLRRMLAQIMRHPDLPAAAPFGDHQGEIAHCWKIGPTPFTSAILNFPGAAYPFHRDAGNVKDSWSIMGVTRGRNPSGGYLVLPEYRLALACANGSAVAFPGATEWHGVTAIGGERWSTVFYAKALLRNAEPDPAAELAAGNRRRTEYERKGAGL